MNIKLITEILVIIGRLCYSYSIYFHMNKSEKKVKNTYATLALFFPIIIGFICLIKEKASKPNKASIALLIITVVILSSAIAINLNDSSTDKPINSAEQTSEISGDYTDRQGNVYYYDFDKSGYEYLYIEGTGEKIDASLCFIDEDKYLVYDDDMSILSDNPEHCTDTDGKFYYPVSPFIFDENGDIDYHNKGFYKYDRYGNPYSYNYVPYYDKEGNKYRYTFNSDTLQGAYVDIKTKKEFENELCFVDKNGYLIYDKDKKLTKTGNEFEYKDEEGKLYYWASSISWDKNANMLDSYGKAIFQ